MGYIGASGFASEKYFCRPEPAPERRALFVVNLFRSRCWIVDFGRGWEIVGIWPVLLRQDPQGSSPQSGSDAYSGSGSLNHSESLCRGNEIESGHSRRSGAFSRSAQMVGFLKISRTRGAIDTKTKRVSAARFPALRDSSANYLQVVVSSWLLGGRCQMANFSLLLLATNN